MDDNDNTNNNNAVVSTSVTMKESSNHTNNCSLQKKIDESSTQERDDDDSEEKHESSVSNSDPTTPPSISSGSSSPTNPSSCSNANSSSSHDLIQKEILSMVSNLSKELERKNQEEIIYRFHMNQKMNNVHSKLDFLLNEIQLLRKESSSKHSEEEKESSTKKPNSTTATMMTSKENKNHNQKKDWIRIRKKRSASTREETNNNERRKRHFYGDGYNCNVERSDEESDFSEAKSFMSTSSTSESSRSPTLESSISSTKKGGRSVVRNYEETSLFDGKVSLPPVDVATERSVIMSELDNHDENENENENDEADSNASCCSINHFSTKRGFIQQEETKVTSDEDEEDNTQNEEAWDLKYKELLAFKRKNNHVLVNTEDSSLGSWVHTQRTQYAKYKQNKPSRMTKRRFQLLDEIDFVWDVYNAAWNSKFVELKEYKELHGDCLVNTGHNANALGRWVNTQRKAHRRYLKNQSSSMTPEREQALNSIDFVWYPRDHKRKTGKR